MSYRLFARGRRRRYFASMVFGETRRCYGVLPVGLFACAMRRGAAYGAVMVLALALLLVAGAGDVSAQESNDWILRRDKDGIRIYVRSVPDTRFHAYRAETTVSTRLQTLAAVLADVDAANEWIHFTARAELVQEIDSNTVVVRFYSDLPWPAADRDSVTINHMSQDPVTGAVLFTIDSRPDDAPQSDDYIRIQDINGYWELTPNGDGSIHVVYSLSSDPGGSVPAWLVNASIVEQPYRTLSNLRRMVEDPRYRYATFPGIVEP